MKIPSTKKYYPLVIALCLLVFSGCFQPVDIGETIVDRATAHLQVTNASADDSYILEGLELRNAEGGVIVVWENLNISKGQSRELSTETAGAFTLWYRIKDVWISPSEVNAYNGGPVEIALNKSRDLLFEGEKFNVTSEDADNDGFSDAWELENGFNPEDPADGHEVYVSHNGDDKAGNGTEGAPYKTLARAVDKASRGLGARARTVVALNLLDWRSGNEPNNPEYPGRADSVFYLGKTRDPVTIRPKDPANAAESVLQGGTSKRVLYLDSGANIVLLDMKVTGGRNKGGGIYASGAKLTLGSGTTITENESSDLLRVGAGGIYMENGVLVMEPGSSVTGNKAENGAGVVLSFSTFRMKGGDITANTATTGGGGLSADGSTVEMFIGAKINGNTVGKSGEFGGDNAGGVGLVFSTLTMYQGSEIKDNWVYSGFGGGLYVSGESKLILKGGLISGNHATNETDTTADHTDPTSGGFGGGIAAVFRSSIVMESGSISGNFADEHGGGVHIQNSASFTMTGGSIGNNEAGKHTDKKGSGGGVFLTNGASFKMDGGSIAANTVDDRGGGVFVHNNAGSFIVGSGGIIYGGSPAVSANKNTAAVVSGTGLGHAVYNNKSGANPAVHNNDISDFSIP